MHYFLKFIFGIKTLHVSDSSSAHHQEFFHCTHSNGICHTACEHLLSLCVQLKIPDDGQRNCPKHVEFYSKNKFEKLVHLVGFIIRIQTTKVAFFQRKIPLSGFSTYPDGSVSQLIRISGVLLYQILKKDSVQWS